MSAKPLPAVMALFALASCAPVQQAPQAVAAQAPAASEWAGACEEWDDWDKPGPPFRIHGNSYYVGTCGIAAILIADDAGHVLIDSGTREGTAVTLINIERLGFDPADIAVMIGSHEHFDHVGGTAIVQARSGAKLYAGAEAAKMLATGQPGAGDPQAGMHDPMAPARVDRVLSDGESFVQGGQRLTMIATPGHTPGAVSWQWEACEDSDCRTIVYADSLSPVSRDDYRFSDHPDYLAAYRAGIARVAERTCDILITPHPSASQMRKRIVAGTLQDPAACRNYADGITARLDERLAKEAAQ